MKHFSLAEWADFARGLVEGERNAAMQSHLDDGCKQCGEARQMWGSVREAALREKSYQPPESLTKSVKAFLPVYGRSRGASIVQLLFDSFQSPATAGIRATAVAARQLLYGVGAYRIDLRMEPQMDSDKVSLVGQILNSEDPTNVNTESTVTLLRGKRVLAQSQTNTLGEFHLECVLEGDLQLHLKLQASEINIPLLVPSEAAMTGNLKATDSNAVSKKLKRHRRSTKT